MSAVTGPISTLPGAIFRAPEGARCDDHPERPAAGRLQGETDSMGSEMHDLCQQCLDEARAAAPRYTTGCCDWCSVKCVDLRNHRDWDEGSSGRVYRVCGACLAKESEELQAELDDRDDAPFGWD